MLERLKWIWVAPTSTSQGVLFVEPLGVWRVDRVEGLLQATNRFIGRGWWGAIRLMHALWSRLAARVQMTGFTILILYEGRNSIEFQFLMRMLGLPRYAIENLGEEFLRLWVCAAT